LTNRLSSRGRRGRSFHHLVVGIAARRSRDRLVQMATNRELAAIAVGPACTSRWVAQREVRSGRSQPTLAVTTQRLS
jgi:hypothetical protein